MSIRSLQALPLRHTPAFCHDPTQPRQQNLSDGLGNSKKVSVLGERNVGGDKGFLLDTSERAGKINLKKP
jgi:hypothetical protein